MTPRPLCVVCTRPLPTNYLFIGGDPEHDGAYLTPRVRGPFGDACPGSCSLRLLFWRLSYPGERSPVPSWAVMFARRVAAAQAVGRLPFIYDADPPGGPLPVPPDDSPPWVYQGI